MGGAIDLLILFVALLFSSFLTFVREQQRAPPGDNQDAPQDQPNAQPQNQQEDVNLQEPAQHEEDQVEDEEVDVLANDHGIIKIFQYFFLVSMVVLVIVIAVIFLPNMLGRLLYKIYYDSYFPEPILVNLSTFLLGNDYMLDISVFKTLALGHIFAILVALLCSFGIQAIFPNLLTKTLCDGILLIASFCKMVFFTISQFGFIPLYLGISLDYFTTDFLGLLSEGIVTRFWKEPIIFLAIHWMLGLFLLFQISITLKTFREFLRPQVMWFLNNPEDPQFNFFREVFTHSFFHQFRRTCMTLLLFTTIILAFARTPLKVCKIMFPDLFPVRFSMSNPFIQSSLDVGLFYLFTLAFDRINPLIVMKTFYKYWMEKMGAFLDLNEYLFPIGPMRKPNMFHLRILYLLFFIWMTGIVIVSTFFVVPLYTGIFVAKYVRLELSGVYLHLIGSYVWIGVFALIKYLASQVFTLQTMVQIATVALNVSGTILLFLLMPYLFGLSFLNTIIFPFFKLEQTILVPWNECWSMGLLMLVFYFRILVYVPLQEFEGQRNAMNRIWRNGILGVKFVEVFRDVIFPEIFDLALYNMIPYCIVNGVIPRLVELSNYEMAIMSRFVYPALFGFMAMIFVLKQLMALYRVVHQKVLDWTNVVENRLQNIDQ